MKKIVTIIGARPQFIKAAVLSRLFKEKYSNLFDEYIVHTGQHYDDNMSQIFFDQMGIPKPNINLEIGSGSHGYMTGNMIIKIEEVLLKQNPDFLLVYGDTNSTLSAAIAAGKLNIPIIHVEAGLRTYDMRAPEEQNRILTDHLSKYLFSPTQNGIECLKKEGLTENVYQSGDVMYDAALYYRSRAKNTVREDFFIKRNLPKRYFLITMHRQENTDYIKRISSIVNAINDFKEIEAVFPMHPRTRKYMAKYNLKFEKHVHVIEPVGYLEMTLLENNCEFVLTDSGGVQKEAYFYKKPALVLMRTSGWPELVNSGWNKLVDAEYSKIISNMKKIETPSQWEPFYGKGNAGEFIIDKIR